MSDCVAQVSACYCEVVGEGLSEMGGEALSPDADGHGFLSVPGVCMFVYSTGASCSCV